ncbi:MAG: hypothetical protein ACJ72L_17025 [Marmoricola sp.]
MKDTAEQIVAELLAQLRAQPLETIWTQYDSGDELIQAVEGAAERLRLEYATAVKDLSLLLAPTGAVQETAMRSGFHGEYMRLAARFDRTK